ncbi:MAG TPA: hypothetical protein VMZ28_22740 [Kofleriaceae bacterium]|nr:hypothetical protein [Kofleriaceae bacterium]
MRRAALVLLLMATCAACKDSGPDASSGECRGAFLEYRAAFATAMGDRMAQLGSWGDKPDMQANLAVGQEMGQAMTERTMTRAELDQLRATEAKAGAPTPEWERAFGAAVRAIERCGEGVTPPPQ